MRGVAIYETFSVCVHMSRNVVVSFEEGYRGYMIFCSRFGGRATIYEGAIHKTLQYRKRLMLT